MSARKNIGIEVLISGVVGIVLVAAAFVIYPLLFQATTDVKLGTATFHARLAIDNNDRINGLSGVTSMSYDDALLMVYPASSKWPVSMKNMKLAVDIVWLNQDKKVVYLIRNAEPQTTSSYKVYKPTARAKYVIELPAGTANARTIKLNSVADFSIDETEVR